MRLLMLIVDNYPMPNTGDDEPGEMIPPGLGETL